MIRAMFLVISFYPLVSVFYRPDNGFMTITSYTLDDDAQAHDIN